MSKPRPAAMSEASANEGIVDRHAITMARAVEQ